MNFVFEFLDVIRIDPDRRSDTMDRAWRPPLQSG